ncbi:MAG TPA: DUF4333 domain-containing protein [Thermoleophilaceae bacterium]|nr:DUF4333 domain-containing protein [Thermoleophilaceae bacterium]
MVARCFLLGLLLVAVAGAGCGDDGKARTVDEQQIESQIERSLSTATAKVTSVDCPGDVESKTGAKFTCKAKLEGGGKGEVEVTETQAPDRFTYAFKPGTVELSGESVDAAVERELQQSGVNGAQAECPEVVEVKTGTTVTCPVKGAGGGVGRVSFEFEDESGSIDASSVETGK